MNVLLINPPRSPENAILANAPEEAKRFIHRKLIGPPLGLLTVASAVREQSVTVLDTKAEYDTNPEAPPLADLVTLYCRETKPDIVGVTCIASEFPYAMQILQTVKQWNPQTLTVAGGLHATLCPEDFRGSSADIVAIGQAAGTFAAIVSAKAANAGYINIPGTFVNSAKGYIRNAPAPLGKDYGSDGYIVPDRSYIRKWITGYRMPHSDKNITYVNTSLGCLTNVLSAPFGRNGMADSFCAT